eukprot:7545896-Prorocentrum_lima.AAC.1
MAAVATPVPGSAPVTPRPGGMTPVILPLDYSLDAQLAALVARPGEGGYRPGVAASSGLSAPAGAPTVLAP